jgi:exosortase/archaeosortase family protein
VLRDGFHFSLPGVNIEVARQCSGINSSLALFTVGVLSAYLFLRSTWSKALLIAVMVPLLIAKNVLRIATICWLSGYVSPDYLHGNLHRHGGLPFAIVGGLTPLLLSVIALRRCETWLSQRALSARLDRGVTEAVIEDMGGGGARRTNGSLVAQHADYRAVIDGENLAVTWKVSGYCRAASETAIGFSIDAETNIPFDNLDCVGFDLRRDPGRRHPIRPVLVGPDGISKKVSVPFLAPLSSQEPFHVVLTCDLPGCMKAREDYCAVTLSFDQDRVARYTMRLTFAHSRPDWVRAYECKPDGEPRLLRSLQAQAKDRSAFDYVDDEYDIAARTTRIYVFRRACRARIAADDEAL